ncbi:PRD domain-containing protein [Erysipelothrix anatis]|uniref:PRD domain-containing protein n=1 Tax=Erysipelothrix anatis TaxID=2683713 RepID=UPI00135A3925|nr:PRD domain-containing protein [Erysipelothrix anatis]
MIIKRIYNNNVILALDTYDKEVVLLGRGIGFQMSKGDTVNESKIEKRFDLDDDEQFKFQELVKDMPMDYIALADDIITLIKSKIHEPLNDSIYTTLTDHISNLVDRIHMGITFDNSLLWNIQMLYPLEYDIATEVVEIISKELDIKIDKDEANFITLHIVNAETNTRMMEIYQITEIVSLINCVVDESFPHIDKENYAYQRFLTHCRWFAHRVLNEVSNSKKEKANFETLNLLNRQYGEASDCIVEIKKILSEKYSYEVKIDEELYLMLHLIKLTS